MRLWSGLKNTVMAVAAVLNIHSENKCYNNEGIGCFSNEPPFSNAAGRLPQSPSTVGVSFLLYTRQNRHLYQLLTNNALTIQLSQFNGAKPTKFIIHGYHDNGREKWLVDMRNKLLLKEDVNVITVDWEKGADTKDYNQAAANTRVVGALIAQLVVSLRKYAGAQPKHVHLIGHSLGAHVAGYAGEKLKGIGRITGLDPAGLAFGGKPPIVRLDSTDASFVDVIHTDGQPVLTLGFGTSTRMGHADFYPNGGKNQPGCKTAGRHIFKLITGKFKKFIKGVGCDHARSRDLYIESIMSSCGFRAFPCDSKDDFEAGLCPCNGQCSYMGYTSYSGRPRGSFYLTTAGTSPFCKEGISV